ncbi:MAG: PIG-L family deacetylase [Gemmatimonadales bacterium]
MRRLVVLILLVLPTLLFAQLEPPSTGGLVALDQSLRLVGHARRVLMIGAHPDDEDTELLTVLVRGEGATAAYLSLNRGEGGQNLIGDELGPALGLLRTEELLSARRLDGAQQFFTRAYDFGFSKSLADTWAHWPQDSVLKDVVRIIRRVRPQVIISIFSGTPRDGHGQHQAAAWAAREAFRVAADPARFPELEAEEGLSAWQAQKLYRSARFDTAATTLTLDGGALDPAVGKSFHQIAMAGRSLHRSQDMGQVQTIGPSLVRLQLWDDLTGSGAGDLWSGIDTTLAGVPLVASLKGDPGKRARAALERYAARLDSARTTLAPGARSRLRALLNRAAEDLTLARRAVNDGQKVDVMRRLRADPSLEGDPFEGELARLGRVRLAALDLVADAISEDDRVIPGQRVGIIASLWNAGDSTITAALCVGSSRLGWALTSDSVKRRRLEQTPRHGACLGVEDAEGGRALSPGSSEGLAAGALASVRLTASVPEEMDYSTPYFLRLPRLGDLYQWDPEDRSAWGWPFEPPGWTVDAQVGDGERAARTTREITLRGNDQGSGEFRRPIVVVPRLDVRLEPESQLWALDGTASRRIAVTVTHRARDTTPATVELVLPSGWSGPPAQRYRFTREDERQTFQFSVRVPSGVSAGSFEVSAVVTDQHDRHYDVGLREMNHSHVRSRTWAVRSAATIHLADLALPKLHRVAYLRGAADQVPEALRGVGLPIEMITGADLNRVTLSAFDAIVVGPRAWETDPDLPGANERLLAFARQGGLVLVQYQQYGYFLGGFAPFPLTVGSRAPGVVGPATTTAARPGGSAPAPALLGGHDRVTDEGAEVTALEPSHPVLRRPNRIGAADWKGWVQERGLYFAHSWERPWQPILEMHDSGEAPLRGGLLIAPLGKGTYIYTGLSFFRQLPAGVPGAYRLFANLLALAERRGGGRPASVVRTDSLKVERE